MRTSIVLSCTNAERVLVADVIQRASFFHSSPLKRFSLGTKNKTLQNNPDGSLTLYAGAKSRGADKESNWLPAPTTSFSLYLRNYWPKQEIVDGTWMPPKVVKL